MLSKGNLHRVEELHDHDHEQHPIEQVDDRSGHAAGQELTTEREASVDEEDHGTRGEQEPEAGVEDVLDPREALRDPLTNRGRNAAGSRGPDSAPAGPVVWLVGLDGGTSMVVSAEDGDRRNRRHHDATITMR
jgi:hypothetical protein